MKMNKNIEARLKNAQSELFFQIEQAIKKTTWAKVKEIISETYYKIDESQYTIGLNGEKCYGVITSVDFKKRDAIVDLVVQKLFGGVMFDETIQIINDVRLLINRAVMYQKIGLALSGSLDFDPVQLLSDALSVLPKPKLKPIFNPN